MTPVWLHPVRKIGRLRSRPGGPPNLQCFRGVRDVPRGRRSHSRGSRGSTGAPGWPRSLGSVRHRLRPRPPAAPHVPVGALAIFGVGRWERRGQQSRPVERHVRVLGLERSTDALVERLATHFDVGRRAEPVQEARGRLAATASGLHEVHVLVAALVAGEPQERHGRLPSLRLLSAGIIFVLSRAAIFVAAFPARRRTRS